MSEREPSPVKDGEPPRADSGRRFRRTLASVIAVQIVTLILLWLVQQHYTP
ncbi:MAG TPA: hypothetical protein VHV78_01575 [Gemmatimonadaceae bacterium]|jgi:hypothetical protein|nr:hypothetical protein [Gemmatimonadaceae bacterium]